MNKKETGIVACQGVGGAFAHLAAKENIPE